MSSFNDHKKVLRGLLAAHFPSVYYQLCPPDAGFPRAEFELRQLSVDDIPYEKYILTLNCYDKKQNETMDDLIDAFIRSADKSIRYTENHYYQIYYKHIIQYQKKPQYQHPSESLIQYGFYFYPYF